jgi:hypothetical protein
MEAIWTYAGMIMSSVALRLGVFACCRDTLRPGHPSVSPRAYVVLVDSRESRLCGMVLCIFGLETVEDV